jgi:glycosyltransferase involved in cell wall biosynthesis
VEISAVDAPEFSVIIPTHNRPDLLAQAIASVQAQTVGDAEIIVVDDASEPPARVNGGVVLVRHDEPRGPAASRNAGVRAATGRVVTFLDDDDLWVPVRLELARRALSRAPIAVCWSRYVDEASSVPGRGRVLEGDVSASIREGMTPNLGQTAVRRDAWIELDETLPASEDVDWWIRMAKQHPVATESEVGLLSRRHAGPRSDTVSARSRIEASLRLFETHVDYFAANRRAAGFHWFRIGLTAATIADRGLARRALWRSLRLRPSGRTVYHLFRALV